MRKMTDSYQQKLRKLQRNPVVKLKTVNENLQWKNYDAEIPDGVYAGSDSAKNAQYGLYGVTGGNDDTVLSAIIIQDPDVTNSVTVYVRKETDFISFTDQLLLPIESYTAHDTSEENTLLPASSTGGQSGSGQAVLEDTDLTTETVYKQMTYSIQPSTKWLPIWNGANHRVVTSTDEALAGNIAVHYDTTNDWWIVAWYSRDMTNNQDNIHSMYSADNGETWNNWDGASDEIIYTFDYTATDNEPLPVALAMTTKDMTDAGYAGLDTSLIMAVDRKLTENVDDAGSLVYVYNHLGSFWGRLITNEATNPSGETNLNNWLSMHSGTDTMVRSTTPTPPYGTYQVKVTSVSGSSMQYRQTLEVGKTYNISCYVYASNTTSISIATFGDGGSESLSTDHSGTWARFSHVLTVGSTGDISIQVTPSPSDAYVAVDGIMITEGDTLHDYFDGDTTDTADATYEWTGVAHSSSSTKAEKALHTWNNGRIYNITHIDAEYVAGTREVDIVLNGTTDLNTVGGGSFYIYSCKWFGKENPGNWSGLEKIFSKDTKLSTENFYQNLKLNRFKYGEVKYPNEDFENNENNIQYTLTYSQIDTNTQQTRTIWAKASEWDKWSHPMFIDEDTTSAADEKIYYNYTEGLYFIIGSTLSRRTEYIKPVDLSADIISYSNNLNGGDNASTLSFELNNLYRQENKWIGLEGSPGVVGGYALSFDGTDDYAHTPYDFPLDKFVVSFWYKTDTPLGDNEILMGQAGSFYLFKQGPNDIQAYAYLSAPGDYATTRRLRIGRGLTQLEADDQWHHRAYVIYVNESGNAQLEEWIDGVLIQTDGTDYTGDATTPSGDFYLAKNPSLSSGYTKVDIKKIEIYHTRLYADDIAKLYAEQSLDVSPNLQYLLNDAYGSYMIDSSGNSNTGTINGAQWIVQDDKPPIADAIKRDNTILLQEGYVTSEGDEVINTGKYYIDDIQFSNSPDSRTLKITCRDGSKKLKNYSEVDQRSWDSQMKYYDDFSNNYYSNDWTIQTIPNQPDGNIQWDSQFETFFVDTEGAQFTVATYNSLRPFANGVVETKVKSTSWTAGYRAGLVFRYRQFDGKTSFYAASLESAGLSLNKYQEDDTYTNIALASVNTLVADTYYWIRVAFNQNRFWGYFSTDGINWTKMWTAPVEDYSLDQYEGLVGLFVKDAGDRITFDNFKAYDLTVDKPIEYVTKAISAKGYVFNSKFDAYQDTEFQNQLHSSNFSNLDNWEHLNALGYSSQFSVDTENSSRGDTSGKITITQTNGTIPSAIRVKQSGITIKPSQRYILSFYSKADTDRTIDVSIGEKR